MYRQLLSYVFLLGLLSAPDARAENPDLIELDTLLGGIETFQADVQQIIVEVSGGVLEESQIVFRLKRPHGFYWETLEPFPELIVTDGESLWHYEPDLWQVTIEDWDIDQSELAAQLLSGRTLALAEEYTVRRHEASTHERAEFLLYPMDPASLYEQVSIYFESAVMQAIHITSTNGQRTLWQFSNQKLNEPLSDDIFTFEMPDDEDIEVMDNRTARP